jgi:hypothetical protein
MVVANVRAMNQCIELAEVNNFLKESRGPWDAKAKLFNKKCVAALNLHARTAAVTMEVLLDEGRRQIRSS